MNYLIEIEFPCVIEFQQNRGIGFEAKFAFAGSEDSAAEAAPQIAKVARALCILNRAHVATDFLPVRSAHRIDRANLPIDYREGRPLASKALAGRNGTRSGNSPLADRYIVHVAFRNSGASGDFSDGISLLAQTTDFLGERQTRW